MMLKRKNTKKIMVGNIQIGNQDKVIMQSMTNTKTHDVVRTVKQINDLVREGADIVRVAILDDKDAQALKDIIKLVKCPIVADIHFNHMLAIEAIKNGAAKIRLNPGNIKNEEELTKILDLANKKNVVIRVGVNSGSLPLDLVKKYGVCSKAMIIAADRYIKLFEKHNFTNIVVSLKATDTLLAIDVYEKAAKKFIYPLHLGITESGSITSGTIKSSVGLGAILAKGIGDTIRVSLTGDPVEEIKVCKKILNTLGLYPNLVDIISCPTCGRLNFDLEAVVKDIEEYTKEIKMPLKVAILGCAVNGPGEAKEADIGIAGGNKSGIIFENGKVIRSVPEKDLVIELKKMIDNKYKEFLEKQKGK
ncbi:MAG: flavodoxin-dependent (E)-4-hydroxy-3-methylbut-2-enyl-diphosphate synthase [Malacoplasma sp.]